MLMGYWGYKTMESDSALDAMFKVIELLEKMWDEATDYGEKMAVVYVLTEAPQVDGSDYRGLKAKAVTFVEDCLTSLSKEALENNLEAFNERCEQVTYLQGLIEKLQEKQGTTLIEKLVGA
tara:strand:- start:478 stop:840 length:363 start_codon:yes stop_codon:yes gene_type:complete